MIGEFDQTPFLIGGNGHDMWATTPLDLPQPIFIEDNGNDFWDNKQLIGGGDHDLGMKMQPKSHEIKPNWMKELELKVNLNPL